MSESEREEIPYTPLFCEENIWQLAKRMLELGVDPGSMWVLFFSNPARQVVMFNQRNAGQQGYVVWDYHVVLQAGELIYDPDTSLPFPVSAADYFRASFPSQSSLAEQYRGFVRRIPAASFIENFYSDRSHMAELIGEDEYPSWPVITPSHGQAVRLDEYWDVECALADGSEVMSVAEYQRMLESSENSY